MPKNSTTFTMNESFPMNAWYAVAWDVELRHELLPRTICNKPLVLYRKNDGTPVVLEDACWHRLLPLSKGKLREDTVVCGYHGLEFNNEGQCTYMPSQETINPSACVRSYPTVEKYRFIWVWMGDPAVADKSKIPDMHWNNDSEWAGDGKMIEVDLTLGNIIKIEKVSGDFTSRPIIYNKNLFVIRNGSIIKYD